MLFRSALVDKNSQFNTNDRIISNAFGTDEALLVLVSVDRESIVSNRITDISSERVLDYENELRETLQESQFYVSLGDTRISDDKQLMFFTIDLRTPNAVGSFQAVLGELQSLVDEAGAPPGVDVEITGMPRMMDRISGYLISDSLNTILITLVFIFVILYLYSRDVVYTLITMVTPVASLVFLAAAMVLLNINVTITLAAVGVLVLGLGADYGIHIATHYSKARQEHDAHEPALIHTISDLKLPITASFITTLAGFLALTLGVSPSSQSQGIVLSLAIAIVYAVTFIFFPIIMTVFADFVILKENAVFEKLMAGLGKLAGFQTKYPKLILWVIGFATLGMMFAASGVEFSNSNSNWIPSDDEVSNSFNKINYAFGQSESITLILKSSKEDLRDAQVARDVNNLVTKLEGLYMVDNVINPYNNLEYDSNIIYNSLTNTPLSNQFNEDFTMTRVVILSQNIIQNAQGKSNFLAEVKGVVENSPVYNTEVSYYGDAVRFDELTDSLQSDAAVTTLSGFALVFFVASIIYASISVGFLALIPILVAVIWAVGLMAILNVPFTTLSTGIVSLVLGVGVDFSIHLLDGIKKYLKRGKRIQEAIERTFSTSGKAIILASITTMVGFSALLLAKLLGTQRMGMSLTISIFSVFIVTFTMIPAVMTILNRRENKKN